MLLCRKLLEKVAAVTLPDMIRVGKQYLSALFDPAASKLAICCHPSKVEETVNAFKECVTLIPHWPTSPFFDITVNRT